MLQRQFAVLIKHQQQYIFSECQVHHRLLPEKYQNTTMMAIVSPSQKSSIFITSWYCRTGWGAMPQGTTEMRPKRRYPINIAPDPIRSRPISEPLTWARAYYLLVSGNEQSSFVMSAHVDKDTSRFSGVY